MKKHLLLFIFFLLLGCQSGGRGPASEAPLHIVFDLDWTLISHIPSSEGPISFPYFRVGDEVYRFVDGAAEILEDLFERPNVKVSFFSGGPKYRNEAVLKALPIGDLTAYDLAYKIMNRDDLTVLSGVDPDDDTLPFTQRFRKDLRHFDHDLSRVLLIEDNDRFALNPQQRRSILWLGQTYEHHEYYSALSQSRPEEGTRKFRPPSSEAWYLERQKLVRTWFVIDHALAEVESKGGLHFGDTANRLAKNYSLEARELDSAIGQQLQSIRTRLFPHPLLRPHYAQSTSCSEILTQLARMN